MDFLGVGPFELFFILLLALIVLGPKEMVKTGQNLGRFIRNLTKSETWGFVRQTAREVRTLPNRLINDSGLEEVPGMISELKNEIPGTAPSRQTNPAASDFPDWSTPQPPASGGVEFPSIESRPAASPISQGGALDDWTSSTGRKASPPAPSSPAEKNP